MRINIGNNENYSQNNLNRLSRMKNDFFLVLSNWLIVINASQIKVCVYIIYVCVLCIFICITFILDEINRFDSTHFFLLLIPKNPNGLIIDLIL